MKLPHLLIALFLSTSFLCSTPLASGQDLRDRNYATVGHIDNDGTVRDRNYATMGYAKGVPQKWAAVFFFFDLP